jgi:Zn-dependent peptidase ImmA (M78 family)/transcriptional regulator with XRE-family HTH domain
MDFNPTRFAQARRRRGLSQRAVALLLGVTDRTVRRWESGQIAPDPATLALVARKLRFAVSYFSRPDPNPLPVDAVSFRALSKARASDRERAVAGGELALEFSDWIDANFDLPSPDLPDLRHYRNNPEGAAIALRTHWGLGDKPITSMVALLESRGVRVFSLAEDCREIDAYSFWQGETPLVFLNTLKSSERSRFDAAHELAHLVLHKHGGVPGRSEEKEANAFAGAFLMPATSIRAFAPRRLVTIPKLIAGKHIWNVSLSALVYRMHELKLTSDWQHFALCRDIQTAGYRTTEPESAPREQSQVFPKIFEALREDGIGKRELAAIFGWDVDELNALIFNLTLSSVRGGSEETAVSSAEVRGNLRLLK